MRAVRDEAELYAHAQHDRVDCLHLHENVDSLPTARLRLRQAPCLPHETAQTQRVAHFAAYFMSPQDWCSASNPY